MFSFPMVAFIQMAITGAFGAEDGNEIQILLRNHGQDNAFKSIKVSSQTTVQDLMDKEALPCYSTLTVEGRVSVLQRGETLSDAVVFTGSTVVVNPSLGPEGFDAFPQGLERRELHRNDDLVGSDATKKKD